MTVRVHVNQAQWDTEYYRTKADALADARALAEQYGVPVRWVG